MRKDPLKLLTLNINFYGDKHGAWPERKDLIVEAIRNADPDVIALQAVGAFDGSNQADEIEGSLSGYSTHFEPIGDDQGMAVISRLPILATETTELSRRSGHDDSFDRIVLRALIESSFGPVNLFNAHVSWVDHQALENIGEVMSFVDCFSGPKLIAGDFNQTPDKPAIKKLAGGGWTDTFAAAYPGENGFTFEADGPEMRIDYIWANRPISQNLTGVQIVGNASGHARMSNHLGLTATFH